RCTSSARRTRSARCASSSGPTAPSCSCATATDPDGACPAACRDRARTWPTPPAAKWPRRRVGPAWWSGGRRASAGRGGGGGAAVVVDPGERRVDVVYAARLADGVDPATAVPVSPEIVECRWFRAGERPELQRETAQALAALDRRGGEG